MEYAPIKRNNSAQAARIGQVLPLAKSQLSNDEYYSIHSKADADDGYAVMSEAHIHKDKARIMPLPPTANNIGLLVNNLMGEQYGWGGKEGLHDCSALLKDLFISLGIWLPRNSRAQAKASVFVSLEDLTQMRKNKNF